jgi:hypothetical protein
MTRPEDPRPLHRIIRKDSPPVLGRDGLEDVETIRRRGRHHTRNLSVPMHLLDVLLPLVDEQQLRGDDDPAIALVELFGSGLFLIGFDREIPERDRVIG